MGNIRKDYVSERFMIVSKSDAIYDAKLSPFAPGHESMTNPSVLSLVAKDGILKRLQDNEDAYVKDWSIRVFERNDPIVSVEAENLYDDKPFYSEPAYGYHYIVVTSTNIDDTFASIDTEQWSNILVAIQDRYRWLYTQRGVKYVSIYADHNADEHNHLHPNINMIALSVVPPTIEGEANASNKILNERGLCPMCQIVTDETRGPREILQTESFIAFCPWSPTYQYEFWIVPKRHTTSFAKSSQKEINDLAMILRSTLGGLEHTIKNVSYSFAFHLSPEKKNTRQIHWHVEVYPVTQSWSGLERGYGIYLNSISPEQAAKKLGSACRREFANLVGLT